MKIAVITPVALLNTYGILGDDYHLCLSRQVFKHTPYAHFYRARARAGDYVILDNSAHEHLEGDGIKALDAAARLINPTEIVLPDRLFFGEDTLDRSTEAYHHLRSTFPHVKLMGVPQGRTTAEWMQCLDGLLELGVDTIGISKDYEVWRGGLFVLVDAVLTRALYASQPIEIHMLGWGRDLAQISKLASLVRGVDSAKPLVYALDGVRLPDVLTETTIPKYPRRTGDYFTSLPHDVVQFDDFARHNIGVFRNYSRGARDAQVARVGT